MNGFVAFYILMNALTFHDMSTFRLYSGVIASCNLLFHDESTFFLNHCNGTETNEEYNEKYTQARHFGVRLEIPQLLFYYMSWFGHHHCFVISLFPVPLMTSDYDRLW